MVETGSTIFPWLIIPSIVLPFITAILIFFRQSYKTETLALLMLVCLLLSVKNLLLFVNAFESNSAALYFSLFGSIEFALLALLFRASFYNKHIKDWINYLLVALVSVAITLHASKPAFEYRPALVLIEATLMILLSLASLLKLIRNQYIFIFHSPLFWIAGGSLFYFVMIIAAELLHFYHWLDPNYKPALLTSFEIIRFIFYLVAALVQQPKQLEEDWKNFRESSPEYRR